MLPWQWRIPKFAAWTQIPVYESGVDVVCSNLREVLALEAAGHGLMGAREVTEIRHNFHIYIEPWIICHITKQIVAILTLLKYKSFTRRKFNHAQQKSVKGKGNVGFTLTCILFSWFRHLDICFKRTKANAIPSSIETSFGSLEASFRSWSSAFSTSPLFFVTIDAYARSTLNLRISASTGTTCGVHSHYQCFREIWFNTRWVDWCFRQNYWERKSSEPTEVFCSAPPTPT